MRTLPFFCIALIICSGSVKAQQYFIGPVGIGFNGGSVDATLEVRKSVPGGLGPVLRLTGGGELGAQCAIDMTTFPAGANPPSFRMIATDVGSYTSRVDFQLKVPGSAGNGLANKMSLTENGYLGIGTSNPAIKLQIVGHLAASTDENLGGFTQLWDDNAIMWKQGNGNAGLRFGSCTNLTAGNWSEKMRLMDNGNLGIGTGSPTRKLQVEGNGYFNGDLQVGPEFHTAGYGQKLDFGQNSNSDPQWIARYNAGSDASELRVNISDEGGAVDRFVVGYTNFTNNVFNPLMHVNANGVVGIGTTVTNSTDYKLYVAGGGVRSTKVKVDAGPWADYVFHASYRLRPLSEVEQYIKQHHHLPEVPSAEEVAKDGIDLGDNQTTLLKKVEELTLYLIEQNKKQEKQQQLIEDQRLLLQNQQQRLDELEKKLKEKK